MSIALYKCKLDKVIAPLGFFVQDQVVNISECDLGLQLQARFALVPFLAQLWVWKRSHQSWYSQKYPPKDPGAV